MIDQARGLVVIGQARGLAVIGQTRVLTVIGQARGLAVRECCLPQELTTPTSWSPSAGSWLS